MFDMTSKDWILLLVPIITNLLLQGTFLFIFQKRITLRYDMHAKRMEADYKIQNQFREMAMSLYKKNKILLGTVTNDLKENSFVEFNEDCVALISYYRANDMFLKRYRKQIAKLEKVILRFNEALEKVVLLVTSSPDEYCEEITGVIDFSNLGKYGRSASKEEDESYDLRIVYLAIKEYLRNEEVKSDEREQLELTLRRIKNQIILVQRLFDCSGDIKSILEDIINKR